MKIELFGSGCKKCMILEVALTKAIAQSDIHIEYEKIDNIEKMIKHQIFLTPALVINEKLVSSAKVLSVEEILQLISK